MTMTPAIEQAVKLLPCPFCGGRGQLLPWVLDEARQHGIKIPEQKS